MTAARQRLGVLGGAFDPPHLAHATLARVAIKQLGLNVLRVIPTGHAWHKTRVLSPAEDRLNMAVLAFAFCPKIIVDDRETRRVGPSYSIDTLLELHAQNPLSDLFLIIGADQAHSFAGWHRWQEVVQYATICVAGRSVAALANGEFVPPSAFKDRFLKLEMASSPTSATAIRARVARSEPIAALVGERVARYISQHHLYLQT